MNWIEKTFNKKRAVIGLCHFKALPGDPLYDEKGGMEAVFQAALADVMALQEGGIDGIQFTNEWNEGRFRSDNGNGSIDWSFETLY